MSLLFHLFFLYSTC